MLSTFEKDLHTDRIQRFSTGTRTVEARQRPHEARQITPFLATKLCIPSAHTVLVDRQRITAQLGQGAEQNITLVIAPACYGKTTALLTWAQQQQQPVAWLSLDANDNDPTHFWGYVAAALNHAYPSVGDELLALIRTERDLAQTQHLELAPTVLINSLMAVADDIMLVLDDAHLITNQSIQRGLAFLVEHGPPKLHLLMASRSDLPLPLARMRASGSLTELRAADLRFTHDEIAALTAQLVASPLPADVTATLAARTEGWAAGVRMAAQSLHRNSDPSEIIRAASGSHFAIQAYFTEEVWQRQPADVQQFLFATAPLDQFNAALCSAMLDHGPQRMPGTEITTTGAANELSAPMRPSRAQAMLAYLERAHVFIVPLDSERHWYRYHTLFAEFLRCQLHRHAPDFEADLHERAAAWYAQHALPERRLHAGRVAPVAATHRGRHMLDRSLPIQEQLFSTRELEVLRLLAAGKSNQEIASTLFIGINTVKMHLKHIYDKLDAHNRVQAVSQARTIGMAL